jgi:hypothetical protein
VGWRLPSQTGDATVTQRAVAEWLRSTFAGPEGGSGRVVLSWTLAGGAAAGGILTGALAIAGRANPGLLVLVGPVLYVAGTLVGLLHGLVLGVVGRPRHVPRGAALRRSTQAAALSLPLLPVSWLTSAAITVGSAVRVEFRLAWLLVGTVGSLVALALCLWALAEACGQVRRAYGRCRRGNAGLLLTALIAAGGALMLERLGPELPGLGRAPGWGLSIPLSVLLTVWFWVPLLYVALHQPTPAESSTPDRGVA